MQTIMHRTNIRVIIRTHSRHHTYTFKHIQTTHYTRTRQSHNLHHDGKIKGSLSKLVATPCNAFLLRVEPVKFGHFLTASVYFQLQDNPHMYDTHVQLIKLLGEEGELDKLRAAREKMNEIFPLTEGRQLLPV